MLLLGFHQPVTHSIGFENMDAVGQAIQQRAGQSLVAQHFRPVFEGDIGGNDQAGSFIGSADHVEYAFRLSLGVIRITELH